MRQLPPPPKRKFWNRPRLFSSKRIRRQIDFSKKGYYYVRSSLLQQGALGDFCAKSIAVRLRFDSVWYGNSITVYISPLFPCFADFS